MQRRGKRWPTVEESRHHSAADARHAPRPSSALRTHCPSWRRCCQPTAASGQPLTGESHLCPVSDSHERDRALLPQDNLRVPPSFQDVPSMSRNLGDCELSLPVPQPSLPLGSPRRASASKLRACEPPRQLCFLEDPAQPPLGLKVQGEGPVTPEFRDAAAIARAAARRELWQVTAAGGCTLHLRDLSFLLPLL